MSKSTLAVLVLGALVVTLVLSSGPAQAQDKWKKGALIGGGVGLLFGDGLGGIIKGAAIGGGIGALGEHGRRGEHAKRDARTGAMIGGGVGLLTGGGLGDALGGALIGGAGGAIYVGTRD
ncbi:MAG: hypothetical protein ABFE08_04810 [Armatimonadia bacterium]